LVLLSIAIAIMAAFVALSLASRIAASDSLWGSWAWTAAGAVSMGGGIWSMHFIGMLAFTLPCGESYDLIGTILSMIPGVLASGVALRFISSSRELSFWRLAAGAVLMGAGIGAMHYSGMAAMRPRALLRYDLLLGVASVVVAVALAFVSLTVRYHLRRYRVSDTVATVIAASVMGLAVAGMHYIAMQAAVFLPTDTIPTLGETMPATLLALLIAIIALLTAAITFAGSIAGRQSELAAGLRTEIAERMSVEAALVRSREQAEIAERAAESERVQVQAIVDAVVDAIITIDCRVG
jgi:NO-binding membrane sensor protein with MHYT domain